MTIIKCSDCHHNKLSIPVIYSHYGFFIGYLKNQIEAPVFRGFLFFVYPCHSLPRLNRGRKRTVARIERDDTG
jgi:hypothetical protein